MSQRFKRLSDPRDPRRPERISLAYGEWQEIPSGIIDKYGDTVTELDLSHNNFFDLKSLSGFSKLNTVILDHNSLSSRSTFPSIATVEILWVNHNQITNLSLFIEILCRNYPNLKYLSMINNNAAPSYFNGGTYTSYTDYRHFVISSLGKLEVLDGITITEIERKEAKKVYGRQRTKSKQDHKRSKKAL